MNVINKTVFLVILLLLALFTGCSNQEDMAFQDFEIVTGESIDNLLYFQYVGNGQNVFYYYEDYEKMRNIEAEYFKYNNQHYGKDSSKVFPYVYVKDNNVLYLCEKDSKKYITYNSKTYGQDYDNIGFPMYITDDNKVMYSLIIEKENNLRESKIIKENEEIFSINTKLKEVEIENFVEYNNELYLLVSNKTISDERNNYKIINQDKEIMLEFETKNPITISPSGLEYLVRNNFSIPELNNFSNLDSLRVIDDYVYLMLDDEISDSREFIVLDLNNKIVKNKKYGINEDIFPLLYYKGHLYENKFVQDNEETKAVLLVDGKEFKDKFDNAPIIGVMNERVMIGIKNGNSLLLLTPKEF